MTINFNGFVYRFLFFSVYFRLVCGLALNISVDCLNFVNIQTSILTNEQKMERISSSNKNKNKIYRDVLRVTCDGEITQQVSRILF